MQYIDIKKAAQLSGNTERHLCRLCAAGKIAGALKVTGRWKVPCTTKVQGEKSVCQELIDVPVNKRDQALMRLGIIKDFEKFSSSFVRQDRSRSEAFTEYAISRRIGKRSLQRWVCRFKDEGLLGLVDKRGGGQFVSDMISDEALELFKSMYLTQQQLSVKTCWQNVCFINKDQQKKWKVPSLQSMYRQVATQIPMYAKVLHREGLSAYGAKCAPYIENDPDSIQPGQIWVGDHCQFNCWVRYRGRWIRPWLTAWQDMRSRVIVGHHISASPNQTTILLAAKQAIDKYGPPDSVKIDNGKDYDSECWTGTTKVKRRALKKGYIDELMVAGIYAYMDIGVSFSIKYHPQSKVIEPFFDTLNQQFTKTVPTYCGADSERKPDYINKMLASESAIQKAHSLEDFAKLAGDYFKAYNNSAHSGRGMDGKTPSQVMAARTSRRMLTEGVAELLLRVWSRELVIGKNGVRFNRMYYGQFDTDLAAKQGKKVRLAYDPQDLRTVYVYDAATMKLITIAEQNQLIQYGSPVTEADFRTATRQKSHALKVARQFRNSQLAANMDLTTLTIKAMQDAATKDTEKQQQKLQTIKPVKTPLDAQVAEHKRRLVVKEVKKAAGAESVETVLDLDFSVLDRRDDEYAGLKIFDDE